MEVKPMPVYTVYNVQTNSANELKRATVISAPRKQTNTTNSFNIYPKLNNEQNVSESSFAITEKSNQVLANGNLFNRSTNLRQNSTSTMETTCSSNSSSYTNIPALDPNEMLEGITQSCSQEYLSAENYISDDEDTISGDDDVFYEATETDAAK